MSSGAVTVPLYKLLLASGDALSALILESNSAWTLYGKSPLERPAARNESVRFSTVNRLGADGGAGADPGADAHLCSPCERAPR